MGISVPELTATPCSNFKANFSSLKPTKNFAYQELCLCVTRRACTLQGINHGNDSPDSEHWLGLDQRRPKGLCSVSLIFFGPDQLITDP